jgi:hypothetical protein
MKRKAQRKAYFAGVRKQIHEERIRRSISKEQAADEAMRLIGR